ncbi:hypothetical protein V2J09_005992 [Rumex salicifolius]
MKGLPLCPTFLEQDGSVLLWMIVQEPTPFETTIIPSLEEFRKVYPRRNKAILTPPQDSSSSPEASLDVDIHTDYVGSPVDKRSTFGYCVLFGVNLVTWRSKKQSVVARSSAESEFRDLAQGKINLLMCSPKDYIHQGFTC